MNKDFPTLAEALSAPKPHVHGSGCCGGAPARRAWGASPAGGALAAVQRSSGAPARSQRGGGAVPAPARSQRGGGATPARSQPSVAEPTRCNMCNESIPDDTLPAPENTQCLGGVKDQTGRSMKFCNKCMYQCKLCARPMVELYKVSRKSLQCTTCTCKRCRIGPVMEGSTEQLCRRCNELCRMGTCNRPALMDHPEKHCHLCAYGCRICGLRDAAPDNDRCCTHCRPRCEVCEVPLPRYHHSKICAACDHCRNPTCTQPAWCRCWACTKCREVPFLPENPDKLCADCPNRCTFRRDCLKDKVPGGSCCKTHTCHHDSKWSGKGKAGAECTNPVCTYSGFGVESSFCAEHFESGVIPKHRLRTLFADLPRTQEYQSLFRGEWGRRGFQREERGIPQRPLRGAAYARVNFVCSGHCDEGPFNTDSLWSCLDHHEANVPQPEVKEWDQYQVKAEELVGGEPRELKLVSNCVATIISDQEHFYNGPKMGWVMPAQVDPREDDATLLRLIKLGKHEDSEKDDLW